MYAILPIVTLALSAASSASALVIPRKAAPAGWAHGYLEDYTVYHTRYLALNCQDNHGKPFFDECCHPLLATENLKDNRPAHCTPSASAASSAALAEPTSTVQTPEDDEDDEEYCDEEDDDDSEDHSEDSHPDNTHHEEKPATTAAPHTEPVKNVAPPKEEETKTQTTEAPAKTPDSNKDDNKDNNKDDNKGDDSGHDSGDNSGGSDTISGGFATFYYQNGVAGACGKVHGDNDLIAAIDYRRYGDLGKQSDLCGKKVHITNPKNGKSVTVSIEDACPTCDNNNSIDLSEGAFKHIAELGEGHVGIKWSFA